MPTLVWLAEIGKKLTSVLMKSRTCIKFVFPRACMLPDPSTSNPRSTLNRQTKKSKTPRVKSVNGLYLLKGNDMQPA